ncbi:MAG TPA: pantoate--beta-alanine ligase, partial [Tichowtungia sp.]|nr:pantoate--beta-alanine ligase [Tichowtungia sp.]
VLSVPTVREPDGLAMSSRNKNLSAADRAEAVCLFQALEKAKALLAAGERDAAALKAAVRGVIAGTSGKVDYIELVDDESLEPVQTLERPALLALAVRFSGARLIDNAVLGK